MTHTSLRHFPYSGRIFNFFGVLESREMGVQYDACPLYIFSFFGNERAKEKSFYVVNFVMFFYFVPHITWHAIHNNERIFTCKLIKKTNYRLLHVIYRLSIFTFLWKWQRKEENIRFHQLNYLLNQKNHILCSLISTKMWIFTICKKKML